MNAPPRPRRSSWRLAPLLLVPLVLLAVLAWQWQTARGFWNERRELRVGVYENPPKVYTDENGQPAGLFVELLEAMARAEGWRPKYLACDWAECLRQLEAGELDLMPDVAFSGDRAKRFDFHQVSVASSWSQVYTGQNCTVLSIADLAGRRVAILRGGIQQDFFDQLMTGGGHDYQAVPVESLLAGYEAVAAGAADAVVTNSFFAARNASRYRLKETPIVFLPATLYFATGKDRDAEVLDRIDAHLADWRRDSGSIYFAALRRAMAMPPEVLVPHWVRWSLIALGLLVFLALSLLLRWLVAQRTQALERATRALEDERANLEGLVADRTAELRALMEEMRAARAQAEAATRLKSEFLANMSHEIRTPMNAILGMLYLALRRELAPELRNHLTKAQRSAQTLLSLINDILDLSRIEAGKLVIEQVEFGLDGVLEQLTDTIAPQAERKGLEFVVRYDRAIPPILVGDPLRLGQVLLNLCGNAVKFTERGEVELALDGLDAAPGEPNLRVTVRDTGIGMAPETRERLFETFSQADQSTTRRFGGSGLGLAICRNLVELMGGRIWIEDSRPGQGTAFCFTVRLGVARQSETRRLELTARAGSLLQDVRLLVVDDNQVSREILAGMLRYFQIDVSTAPSGPAALAALAAAGDRPFDAVLMDWRMPGMNGDEAARRLRCDPAIPRQPRVVMVTAQGREEVLRLAEQSGVDGFLIKPVSPSTLLDTLLSVLGRGRILGTGPWPALAAPERGAPGDRLRGARILLVEDNAINREFACELLRGVGIAVDEAADGLEALARVQAGDYDCVLMDIQMPTLDGLETAHRIRALAAQPGGERFATLPIVAMTALAMVQDAERSRAAGMNDHIAKPIDPERLLEVLAYWVRRRERSDPDPGPRPAAPVPAAPEAGVRTPPPAGEDGRGTERSALELPPDLLALTSLEVRDGVRRIGGRAEAYRRQLVRFRQNHADSVEELARLIAAGELQRASQACHALRGVAGNLGAQALHASLSAIEAALRRGEPPDAAEVAAARRLLALTLREIDGLEAAAPAPSVAAPLAPDRLRDRLERLDRALRYDLGAAQSLLAELRDGTAGTELAPGIAAIAALVESFSIDEALTQLDALRAGPTADTRGRP